MLLTSIFEIEKWFILDQIILFRYILISFVILTCSLIVKKVDIKGIRIIIIETTTIVNLLNIYFCCFSI